MLAKILQMRKTYLEEEYFDQDWEPMVLKGKRADFAPPTKHAPTFGAQLIEARRLAQETQHSVAQSVGVPLTTLESWEKDVTKPTKSQLVRLNRVLRCDKKLK